ncbi:MAG: 1-deoxy-D-xylulose-5-phosphate synthase [Acidobacteria bacterium]|nr:1-deoxy-D-xylulose-5-phosphate synthase [Acidobacteriota bacterium]MBV9475865.1 1-deoxy-D-xylulose-5-phosphate synthase [Acidobacteriota bacterium]
MARLLDSIETPRDLRKLDRKQLPQVAEEIRETIVDVVSRMGGHFGGNLGVVELTLALHYVFDTPRDQIVFDTGHQSYPHKLITGRRDTFHTIRQHNGISGFCKREESEYDVFNAGHASTSISAALGIAVARDFRKEDYRVVAIIGDGALSGGLAFEGLNQAGHLKRRMMIVLNDNDMSISTNVGAISGYLNQIIKGQRYNQMKDLAKGVMDRIPLVGGKLHGLASDMEQVFKHMIVPGTLFEELGFKYLGPYDGHDLETLLQVFDENKDYNGPVLIHVITKKGKGYKPAENKPIWSHGVSPFDVVTGEAHKAAKPLPPTYTAVFADALIEMAKQDPKVVAITAAMPDGTGLDKFAKVFPERMFDVGIAEEHAVTFSGGLATQGMKPVAAIYSTFLQRAFDQVFHDVAIMDLPVVFALDRGGIAGADGPTHHGIYDMAYLRIFPNMICMAPKDENELRHMVKTALGTGHPTSLRYPRGNGVGVQMDAEMQSLPVGKGEVMREGPDAAIFAIGTEVWPAVEAAELLARDNINVTVINARFIKPLDDELIAKYCQPYSQVFTVEEGSLAGGFGAAVQERCEQLGIQDVRFHRIGIPDEYVHHGAQDVLRAQYDLHAEGIARRVREAVGEKPKEAQRFFDAVEEIRKAVPDEAWRAAHEQGMDSEHIDEIVTGKRRAAVK